MPARADFAASRNVGNPTLFPPESTRFESFCRSGDLLCHRTGSSTLEKGGKFETGAHHFPVASSGGWLLIIVIIS
jgi:hypothetical protein